MDEKTKEQYYHQFTPLLHKTVKKYYIQYGIEYDELYSEACLIFVEACNKFDEKKACFHTYLSVQLIGKLNAFCRKETLHSYREESFYECPEIKSTDSTNVDIFDCIEKLSNVAKKIINAVLYQKVNFENAKRKTIKRKIEKHFMSLGYKQRQIRNAFYEIQGVL